MKKLFSLILVLALIGGIATADTFTREDNHTKGYVTDEWGELELTDSDFSPEAIAETVFAICEQYYWKNDGSFVDSVDVDDGIVNIKICAPAETIAPLPEKAYYLATTSQIVDQLLKYPISDQKWDIILFSYTGNGDDIGIIITKDNIEEVDGIRIVDDNAIVKQLP